MEGHYYINGSQGISTTLEDSAYRTHPENLMVSAMMNIIKGFERGEIRKADISAGFSRLAPLIIKLSKRVSWGFGREMQEEFVQCLMMAEIGGYN